ncbi:E1 ubiquitin-activating protein aos1 [Exophiala xenobiotica]|nr:E1 ubiquitin-activating protein aos1 [Exophiala xenobiotica]KAK5219814.1 E1 ubiquitin-activating protein aos1 [Exophiala xenobiotica]KAK5251891.1 E1 ubiquitin-activating protein aos1 [Exophiala xenobiotica]KAK5282739.1 E1 ubiquitin-activating protein aos1 [Exophiala xenobiotica]KAK5346845.1 E1 ubiquitin-activating protein aos1 [Exophiala xenobiotica]
MDGNNVPEHPQPGVPVPALFPVNGTMATSSSVGDLNGHPQMFDSSFSNLALPMNGAQSGLLATATQNISTDEIALYDRQIRLWGMQVQEKLRQANLLLIGIRGLGAEIAKNLVLAGIGTLTILDHEMVAEEDLGTQFFLNQTQIGQNRAEATLPELQKLNPRVQLFTDPNPVVLKDPVYFQAFDIIIATDLMMDVMTLINMSCRQFGRKFYSAATHGMYGYIFADLMIHQFIVEKPQSNKPPKEGAMETSTRRVMELKSRRENEKITDIITYQETYSLFQLANMSPLGSREKSSRRKLMRVTPLLSCLRALFDFQSQSEGRLPGPNRVDLELFTKLAKQKHMELELPEETLRADFLRSFLQNLGSEISPVVAFLGGFLAQDVINVLGQKEPPLQNFLVFDGEDFAATQFSLHPNNDDAVSMMNANGGVSMMPGLMPTANPVPAA